MGETGTLIGVRLAAVVLVVASAWAVMVCFAAGYKALRGLGAPGKLSWSEPRPDEERFGRSARVERGPVWISYSLAI